MSQQTDEGWYNNLQQNAASKYVCPKTNNLKIPELAKLQGRLNVNVDVGTALCHVMPLLTLVCMLYSFYKLIRGMTVWNICTKFYRWVKF